MPREFPDAPIVAVGAVVLDEDRILLIRRAQEPLKGEWSLPGGVVELGETLEEALRREVFEEAGIVAEPVKLVEVLSSIVHEGDAVQYHYVIVDYLCRADCGTLRCSSDVSDAVWAAREELNTADGYAVTSEVLAVVDKALHLRTTLDSWL